MQKDELEEIRKQQALVEWMIGIYRRVLERIDPADLVPCARTGSGAVPGGKKALRKAAPACRPAGRGAGEAPWLEVTGHSKIPFLCVNWPNTLT